MAARFFKTAIERQFLTHLAAELRHEPREDGSAYERFLEQISGMIEEGTAGAVSLDLMAGGEP